MKRYLPWLIPGAFALWFLSTLWAPRRETFKLSEFAELPLVFNGRHQPMDSLARNSLVQIRDRYTVRAGMTADELARRSPMLGVFGVTNRTLSATEWLAEVMMKPEVADNRRAFRINHSDLISLLKLPTKDETQGEDGKHYSWNQLSPGFKEIEDQAKRIAETKKDTSQRDAFDQAVLKLHNALTVYLRLKNSVHPQDTTNFRAELAAFEAALPAGVAAVREQQAGRAYDTNAFETLLGFAGRYDVTVRMDTPLLVPPRHPGRDGEEWTRVGETLLEHIRGEALPAAVNDYGRMATAFRAGDVAGFNAALAEYRSSLSGPLAPELRKGRRETFFNAMAPFYDAMVIYVTAFLFAVFFWFNFDEWSRRTAFGLIGLGFIIHTTGLLFRMFLEGRPPVTNLYSSAIFIGWGSVVLGMLLEKFWRNAIGLVVASVLGCASLFIAHNLALDGDTMIMLRAVLDTNFWLATHVVIVTLGYASTYVAGFLAVMYIVLGVFTPRLFQPLTRNRSDGLTLATAGNVGAPAGAKTGKTTRQSGTGEETAGRMLARMVYGIICFATLFSFVGTVLGGIWADQSWGRFWGWDPKENGALIIVLWNALILHARWGGLVRERGLINLAIVGNIVTSWSWFGTNMLGIGLHSYGFMSGAFYWLGGFILCQLGLIGLGLLPPERWRSFPAPMTRPPTPSAPKPARGGKPEPAAA